jgi:hypothetical protein
LKTQFVYKISDSRLADQYMEILIDLLNNKKNLINELELHAIMQAHIQKCAKSSCLCKFIEYKYGELRGRTVKEHLLHLNRRRQCAKYVLYDDEQEMASAKKEHTTSFGSQVWRTTTNLEGHDIKKIISNFYHVLLEQNTDDAFGLLCSHLSYLIYEATNCVGTLVSAYNYIFSFNYSKFQNQYRHIILQNFIDLAGKTLMAKFSESTTVFTSQEGSIWLTDTSKISKTYQ